MFKNLDKESAEESKSEKVGAGESTSAGRLRSFFSVKRFGVVLGVAAVVLLIFAIFVATAYRTGYIDEYVEDQFVIALDEMGVKMEAERFQVGVSPFRMTIEKAVFTNKETGEKLVRIENAVFDMSVMDMLALSAVRNVSIDRTEINGLDVWIQFDENGKSNFSGIEILPPKNRVRFQYSSAIVAVRDARVHFGDEVRHISGAARNLAVFLKPDTERAPDSKETGYLFDLTAKESTFTYDERIVKPIDVESNGRIDEDGAEITRLALKSPIGTTLLSGKLKDWRRFAYDLKIQSTIDLTQSSSIFALGTAISGIGSFSGTVKGRGESYEVVGEVTSESLAASNVRLKAVKVTGRGDGEGSIYKASGKAIAEMLTFGDFRIDFPTMVGSIRGSGSDFRWIGELQAAAAKSPLGTFGSLFIADAVAEYEEKTLRATLGSFRARKFSNDSVDLESIQSGSIRIIASGETVDAVIPGVSAARLNVDGATMSEVSVDSARVSATSGSTVVTAPGVRVGRYDSPDTKLRNISAGDVRVANQRGITRVTAGKVESEQVITGSSNTKGVVASNVNVDIDGRDTRIDTGNVRIASVETDSAVLGNLNIAGVRLTVREGTISGETADFNAGDVSLRDRGNLKDVSARRPVFVLEPSGRYRASLDMSLGSGVIGNVRLGAAKASVVADNDTIALNSLQADVMDGNLDGAAKLALSDNGNSELRVDFRGLDLSKLLALQGGRVVPLQGRTDGRADLTFKGTDFRRATGTLNAEIMARAGTDDRGLIPVSGKVGLAAVNGLFNVDYASLETEKSNVNADGRFDLNGYDSNLTVALTSSDASEIDRIARVMNFSPELEEQLDAYEISPEGALTFNGTLTGNLTDPMVQGRTSLESLVVRERDLGTLVASVESNSDSVRVNDGILQTRDGGNVGFSIEIPATGSNNILLNARLNDVDLANLMVLVPRQTVPEQMRDIQGKTTGDLALRGIPNNIEGVANLATRNGTVNGQSFENLVAKAEFEGNMIRLSGFDADFDNGTLSATGFYDSASTEFDFDVKAVAIPAEKVLAFFPKSDSVPEIEGKVDLTANASGKTGDTSTFDVNFAGVGENVSINKSMFGSIDFEGKTENRILNATASTNFSGKKQLITARLDFSREEIPFSAESDFNQSPVGPYIRIFRPSEPGAVEITGQISGSVRVAGNLTSLDPSGKRVFSWDNLSGSANLSQAGLQFDETPLTATEPVVVRFTSRELVFENAKFAGGGSNLVIAGTKALTDSGINNLEIAGKVDLGIVRAFSRETLKNIFVNGVADVAIRLSGVNRTARLNGTAILERGSAATFVGSNRITFERLKGRIRFTTNQVQIEEVTAFLGGGRITASGGALLTDNLSLDRIRLEIRGTNATAPLPDDFLTTGNADIEINGRREGDIFSSFVSGTIITRRSVYTKDIDLADLVSGRRDTSLVQSSDTVDNGDVTFTPPRLDIRILGRDSLIVRNNLADLSATADLRLTGDTESPRLSGRITANSGTVFFRDDRYELQRGVLTFPPNTTIEPRVNLQAETDIKGYQVFINLSGNLSDADSLTAVVTSNPSLPQADVISLITTGSLSNTDDGIPTLAQGGLNTAAKILTDEIINRPIARATDKLFGINRFELDPIVSGQRGNPTARLTVGRQINRNLLATYSTNLSEDQNQVLALEYRVSNRLSFVAAYEQRSLSNVTRNRNKFSFEIRLRKRF